MKAKETLTAVIFNGRTHVMRTSENSTLCGEHVPVQSQLAQIPKPFSGCDGCALWMRLG